MLSCHERQLQSQRLRLKRSLSFLLALALLLQSLAPALAFGKSALALENATEEFRGWEAFGATSKATEFSQAPTAKNVLTTNGHRIGLDRQSLGTVGMGYGVTGIEHHQYLVDTSQPYAEVIQEAEWVNNALPLITRYDIGLDRLRMFKYQVTSNGPPPVYSPVVSGWYLFDGLGSTRALVDDSGAGTDLWGYQDAFGIPNRLFPATGGTANSFFLNGQQFDNYEGLYFNRARYYQPGLGRFIGKDPFEGNDLDPESLHRYIYTSNNPVVTAQDLPGFFV